MYKYLELTFQILQRKAYSSMIVPPPSLAQIRRGTISGGGGETIIEI